VRFQYRVLQVPVRWGAGAFVPVPAQINTAASNGQNEVVGAPGTVAIPSPRPPALNDGQLGGPFNQPSSVSPNVFYPSLYHVVINNTMTFDGRGTGLTPGNDHPMPVPARNWTRMPANFNHRVRVGGRTTTTSNRPFTQWPTYGGRKA
jgi:hypothetical protein